MEIKDIIKARRQELRLTLADVAARIGVSEATVSRWESGSIANMRRDRILLLAKALQLPPSVITGEQPVFTTFSRTFDRLCLSIAREPAAVAQELSISHPRFLELTERGAEPTAEEIAACAAYFDVPPALFSPAVSAPASNLEPLPPLRRIPLIGTIACGKPILAQENHEDMVGVPDDIHADFCLRCQGDSMINARIFDGDLVYIRKQPDVDDGEIAAVRIGDTATLKRVYHFPNRLLLRAENPMVPDLNYDDYSLEEIEILGKAVAFLSTVR